MNWTLIPYCDTNINGTWLCGETRYTISNGHISFDISAKIDGSGRDKAYPDGYTVHPNQIKPYAEQIVDALNAADIQIPEGVGITIPRLIKHRIQGPGS